MSKLFNIVVAFTLVFLFCLSTVSHAKQTYVRQTPRIPDCGYVIFKATQTDSREVVTLCLHSRYGENYVTLFAGKAQTAPFSVSNITYSHVVTDKTEKDAINIILPEKAGVLTFTRIKSENKTFGMYQYLKGKGNGEDDTIKLNGASLRINFTFEDKGTKTLNDYGVYLMDAKKQASHIYTAPAMGL